jgi:hypothetical protein
MVFLNTVNREIFAAGFFRGYTAFELQNYILCVKFMRSDRHRKYRKFNTQCTGTSIQDPLPSLNILNSLCCQYSLVDGREKAEILTRNHGCLSAAPACIYIVAIVIRGERDPAGVVS